MDEHQPLAPRHTATFYFIGVSTLQSSIMNVFPRWATMLGLDAQILGCDAPLGASPATYRAIVEHIKHDPHVRGALVTTHKIDLLNATRDLFDQLDPYAQQCGEVSCIAKRGNELWGFAKDPISSALSWAHFVPPTYRPTVLCLGAGGAAMAISLATATLPLAQRPTRFIVVDINPTRLDHLREVHQGLHTDTQFEYILNADALTNDALVHTLPERAVIINATGMGKDRPGSPVTDAVQFPHGGILWELNYRGERQFLQQARTQEGKRQLIVEDGWVYFLHGWTQVIAEVFQLELTADRMEQFDSIASELRPH